MALPSQLKLMSNTTAEWKRFISQWNNYEVDDRSTEAVEPEESYDIPHVYRHRRL